MSAYPLESERRAVSDLGREMVDLGLTKGTGGNVSEQGDDDLIAVSPTRIPYDEIGPGDVPVVDTNGEPIAGETIPSSETPMHTAIYRARDDVGGIVHTHSLYASTFASLGEAIPASHYLLAYVGKKVPVAGYERPASEALAKEAVEALGQEYDACLLQNHGVMATGETAEEAIENALMVEYCAQVHYQAKCIGDPIVLGDDDLDELITGFDEYRRIEQ